MPPSRVLWHTVWVRWHAPHLIGDIRWWLVCILIWHWWVWGWGVHVCTIGIKWISWYANFLDLWNDQIGLTCRCSWVGEWGRLFFTYLKNNWTKVGLALTDRSDALNVFVFHVPISYRRALKVCGRCCSWALSDHPSDPSRLFDGVPDCPRLSRTIRAAQNRRPHLVARPRLPRSTGHCDDDLQSLSSIWGLFCHHFPARNFGVFIGLSWIADDDLLVLIGHARPN
jgi:hypothetical protein